MKKLLIAGLLAVSAGFVVAAPTKTSKAVVLTDAQMQSVKGQGYLYVYVWNYNGIPGYTTVINGQDLGYTTYYYQIVHSGGPENGVVYW